MHQVWDSKGLFARVFCSILFYNISTTEKLLNIKHVQLFTDHNKCSPLSMYGSSSGTWWTPYLCYLLKIPKREKCKNILHRNAKCTAYWVLLKQKYISDTYKKQNFKSWPKEPWIVKWIVKQLNILYSGLLYDFVDLNIPTYLISTLANLLLVHLLKGLTTGQLCTTE